MITIKVIRENELTDELYTMADAMVSYIEAPNAQKVMFRQLENIISGSNEDTDILVVEYKSEKAYREFMSNHFGEMVPDIYIDTECIVNRLD